jgi:hypothetical protein
VFKQISYDKLNVAKSPLKFVSRSGGFKHSTEEKLNWKKINTVITDIGSVKLNVT